MKRSRLALVLLSSLVVAACDDGTRPPVTVDTVNGTTAEDTALSYDVPVSAAAAAEAEITYFHPFQHGTVTGDGTHWTYTPELNFNGEDSATLSVTTQHYGMTEGSVHITVTPVNDAPVANPDTLLAQFDTVRTVTSSDLVANDTDVDGDTLIIQSVTAGQHGTAAMSGTNVLFTPDTGFGGAAGFTYSIVDGHGGMASSTVTLTVGADTAPLAHDDSVATNEDAALTVNDAQLLFNDSDAEGSALSITAISAPSHGTATHAGSSVIYTPTANYNGADSFTYTTTDGTLTATATVMVNVIPVNDAPVAADDTATTAEDTALVLAPASLLANDSDLDGDTLTVANAFSATHGTVTVSGGTVTYTPVLNYNGPASFVYTVSDPTGASATATVAIVVTSVNDNPVANADMVAGTEDQATTIAASTLLANDTDVDGDTLTVSGVTAGAGTHGTVTLSGTGVLYTPVADFNGVATFAYTVSDGQGGSASAMVTVTVAAVNDAPTAVNDTFTTAEDVPLVVAGSTLTLNDTDDGGNANLTVASVGAATNGTVTLSGQTVKFVPSPNYYGPASFTYVVRDAQAATATATVSITVTPVNDAPVAIDDQFDLPSDSTSQFSAADKLLANDVDVDGDAISLQGVQATAETHGTLSVSGDTITFTPEVEYQGRASFEYTIVDPHGATDSGTARLCIGGPCTDPVAIDDLYEDFNPSAQGGAVGRNDAWDLEVDQVPDYAYDYLFVLDNDEYNVSVAIELTSGPAHGDAFVDGGVIRYIPDLDYCNDDGSTYDMLSYKLVPSDSPAQVLIKVRCSSGCELQPSFVGCPCEGFSCCGFGGNQLRGGCLPPQPTVNTTRTPGIQSVFSKTTR
ncbi:MAG TPA: Ig-like domain-containing protein [Kofleriaceae bacterium]|jgi:hypothetical protein